MPGGYSFDHVGTLRLIDLYYNSKFKSGQYDSLGLRKFFFNIVKPTCDIATKFVDLDTKDIIVMPEGDSDEIPTWFMQKRLKRWLQDNGFAHLLNEIGFDYPKYGTVVLKKVKGGEIEKVNIQNLRMDPTVECLDESSFVYEILSMARHEIDDMGWDTSELYSRGEEDSYIVYECFDRSGSKWKHTVYGDLMSIKTKDGVNRAVESEINNRNDYAGALVLHEDEVDELPYRELHWERVPGRWLGFGFVEYLEENQVAINDAENLERKGLAFTSLNLFNSSDEELKGSNILTATQNGDILVTSSPITKIGMEERNLAAFNNTRGNWSANTERKTFSSDITTGASLPSRTPLGVANIQAAGASSYFELKRENFGLFVKDLIMDDIIPSFMKDTAKEHTLMIAGSDQDIELYDQLVSRIMTDEAAANYAGQTGFFPSQEQKQVLSKQIQDQMRKNKNRYTTIPKNFYKDAKYYIDITITGENVDNGTKSQVIQLALQIVGTNPGIVQNPVTKNLLFSLLSLGGVSPAELGLLNQSQAQPQSPGQPAQQPQVAGSMAAPAAMPTAGVAMNKTMML